jgi:hypothetical protein
LELFNTSTPEKAFKTSVRPIAYLCIFQSICLLFVFTTWSVGELVQFPLPFIPDPIKKSFLIATAILILIIGIGLFFRSKPIWYIFLAYITLGPLWIILGLIFNYFPGNEPKMVIVPLAIIFSAAIAVGLYIVTKPAFK